MMPNEFQSGFPTPDKFIGREQELSILRRELVGATRRTVIISGPPGIGKTSLALNFAQSSQETFTGGIFNLEITRFESIVETVSREVQGVSGPYLVILNDVELRPQNQLDQELDAVRRLHPNAMVLVTTRHSSPGNGTHFQLSLDGLQQSEFRELIVKGFDYVGSSQFVDELHTLLLGHPLSAQIATDMIKVGALTPRELLERLKAFTSPGIVGPTGKELPEKTANHRRIISDVEIVSDDFLRKLRMNPRLLYELTPRGFEQLVADLLSKLDYKVTLTPASKDGGKDIYAAKKDHLGTFLYIVECKKYAPDRRVGVGLVRELHGVVNAEQATAGILATTSFFTKGAQEFQQKIPFQMSLMDYVGVQSWLETALRSEGH